MSILIDQVLIFRCLASSQMNATATAHWREQHFTPMEVDEIPNLKLRDIVVKMSKGSVKVVNMDALLPVDKALCLRVLRTVLPMLPRSCKVLSLRFNQLNAEPLLEVLLDWIAGNDHVETLYIMSCDIQEKDRLKLEAEWRKHLKYHQTENMGYTLVRIPEEEAGGEEGEEGKEED